MWYSMTKLFQTALSIITGVLHVTLCFSLAVLIDIREILKIAVADQPKTMFLR